MAFPKGFLGASNPASVRMARHARVVARLCAAVSAVLAAAAGISVFPTLTVAAQDQLMVETWRVVGFMTFAAIFALLALRPLIAPSLWLIVFGNKVVLTVFGLSSAANVPGAAEAAAWDGVLVVLLGVGFLSATVSRRLSEGMSTNQVCR